MKRFFATLACSAALLAAADKGVLPVEGLPSIPVKVTIYEDLQCPDCAAFRKMMDEHLLPRFGQKVAFLHKDSPQPKHPLARPVAVAGRHFATLSAALGVRYRQHVFARIPQITPQTLRDEVAAFARAQGADAAAALRALDDPELQALVERDYQEGVARGVVKTPTVFVNGRRFNERFTVEEIAAALEEALR